MGPSDGVCFTGSLRSAVEHDLPHERLDRDELRRRHPQFEVPDDYEAVYEPKAGVLLSELVISTHAQLAMKDGAVIANSGHFNVEINLPALEEMSEAKRRVRESVDEHTLEDGRKIRLLGEGRLINLAAAEGHPASVMDMSFANQALSAEHLVKHAGGLPKSVHAVPREIDRAVAELKLETMEVRIDRLTAEQQEYLGSWELGT